MLRPASLILFSIASALLPCLPASGQVTPPLPLRLKEDRKPQEFASVEAAIIALGNDEFLVRQDASAYLWRAGQTAEKALEAAAKSDDAEIRLRASLVLRKVKLGITPETPLELQQLITAYYDGDRGVRQQVISQLRQKEAFKTIFALLQMETDADMRRLFFATLRSDFNRLAPQIIASGDWTTLEQFLDLGKTTDAGRAQFATYLLLRGRLPEELARSQQELAKLPDDPVLVAYHAALLRVNGQPEQALALVADSKLTPPGLLQALARDQGDWLRLAKLHEAKAASDRLEAHRLAIRGTCFRLAHDDKAAEDAFSQLKQLAPRDDMWYAAKVLLLNDRPEEAIQYLSPGLQPMAFDLLAQRQQHGAALALAGITDETTFDMDWLSKLTGQQSVRTSRTVDRFTYAVSIALELRLVGKVEQADALQGLLHQTANFEDQNGQHWNQLARLERRPGRQAELLAYYARSVDRNPTYVFTQLFPKKLQPRAAVWWDLTALDTRGKSALERLTAVAVALQPNTYKSFAADVWPPLVKLAEAKGADATLETLQRGRFLVALAEAWQARGDKEAAKKQFRAAIDVDPATAEAFGDFLLTEEQWTDAVQQYRRAVEVNPGNTSAWVLLSVALQRAGEKEAAGQAQQTANLMALDSTARYNLGLALQDRNLRDEARENWQFMQRNGFPDDPFVMAASQYMGSLVAEQNPLAAAKHWEQTRFYLLRPTANLIEQSGYLELSATIHRMRAKHLLAAGDKAGALIQIRAGMKTLPGNIKFVEELFPLLRKAELTEEADELFENCYQVYAQAAERYPRSAHLHNQAAWLAAICVSRLDDALALAEEAVRLDPDSASFLDTLAEVHFARGDRDRAIEWSKKSLAIDPDSKFHQERLEKFKTRELPENAGR